MVNRYFYTLRKRGKNAVADGVGVADPQNQELFPNERFKSSLIDVPGDDQPKSEPTVICNSGVLATPSTMPPLTKEVLKKFHGPVIYIMGGPSDIAYKNAMDDYSRISHVPVAMTNLDVGHGGTYRQPHGGEFTRVALGWMDWQLKAVATKVNMFLGENSELKNDPKRTIEVKNFE